MKYKFHFVIFMIHSSESHSNDSCSSDSYSSESHSNDSCSSDSHSSESNSSDS